MKKSRPYGGAMFQIRNARFELLVGARYILYTWNVYRDSMWIGTIVWVSGAPANWTPPWWSYATNPRSNV